MAWTLLQHVWTIYYRHIIICPRHWPLACLWNWAEFNFAGKLAVDFDCCWWKYFIWTSSADAMYSNKTIDLCFQVKWLKTVPVPFAFHTNLSTSTIHYRCAGGLLVWEPGLKKCQQGPMYTKEVFCFLFCFFFFAVVVVVTKQEVNLQIAINDYLNVIFMMKINNFHDENQH